MGTIGGPEMTAQEALTSAFAGASAGSGEFVLDSGSRVAVIGGGPAGSFFSFYILDMAERMGIDIQVDVYEPRDFSKPAPQGCNMCGGIISETLVQNLAADGINLPPTVVQRGMYDEAEKNQVLDCIECGSCAYICPSNRELLDYIRLGKSTISNLIRERQSA